MLKNYPSLTTHLMLILFPLGLEMSLEQEKPCKKLIEF